MLLTQWSGGTRLYLEHSFFTTQLSLYKVEFEACNLSACLSAPAQTIKIE